MELVMSLSLFERDSQFLGSCTVMEIELKAKSGNQPIPAVQSFSGLGSLAGRILVDG